MQSLRIFRSPSNFIVLLTRIFRHFVLREVQLQAELPAARYIYDEGTAEATSYEGMSAENP